MFSRRSDNFDELAMRHFLKLRSQFHNVPESEHQNRKDKSKNGRSSRKKICRYAIFLKRSHCFATKYESNDMLKFVLCLKISHQPCLILSHINVISCALQLIIKPNWRLGIPENDRNDKIKVKNPGKMTATKNYVDIRVQHGNL